MADDLYYGSPTFFNDDVTFYGDVNVYGKLNFTKISYDSLYVRDGATINQLGIAQTALVVNGDARVTGIITASQYIVSNGSSVQFLKANGTLDSTTYLTAATVGGISENVPNTIIQRNGLGGFSAGIITATSLTVSGNSQVTGIVSTSSVTDLSGGYLSTPPGTIIYHSTSTAPTGYLKANGASLSTTTYATLFAVIGYTYGGSGASFSLPDLRGQFIRSWADNGTTYDSGRAFGGTQADDFKNHQHEFGADDQVGPQGSYTNLGSFSYDATSTTSGGAARLRTRDDTTNFGTTETRPRNIALLACIKY